MNLFQLVVSMLNLPLILELDYDWTMTTTMTGLNSVISMIQHVITVLNEIVWRELHHINKELVRSQAINRYDGNGTVNERRLRTASETGYVYVWHIAQAMFDLYYTTYIHVEGWLFIIIIIYGFMYVTSCCVCIWKA